MKNTKNTLIGQLKKPRTYIVLVIIIAAAFFYFSSKNSTSSESVLVVRPADFINQVSVSGKVVAADTANLGFDQSGRVATISAKVGDRVEVGQIIATVESADLAADLAQKQAKLASLIEGTRPEELALYAQKYTDATDALITAEHNAYVQTEDAVLNKADGLFTNGNSSNPTIVIRTQSDIEQRSINDERLAVRDAMVVWKSELASLGVRPATSSLIAIQASSRKVMMMTKNFIDHLNYITGNLTTGNSALSQTAINNYQALASASAQAIVSAQNAEQTVSAAWSSARDSYTLQNAGTRGSDIDAARADVESVRAKLAKTTVKAPFSGIITKMDLKVGEIASPTVSQISLMSAGRFQIESYIPEVYIASVKLGDPATTTLDAYGSDMSFTAHVISIDPAETIRDGVSTYKVKLQFDIDDARIRSGMTSNVLITTEFKSHVISIPRGVIVNRDGQKFVKVKEGKVFIEKMIQTGSTSPLGQVEIVSGLNDGDVVSLNSESN